MRPKPLKTNGWNPKNWWFGSWEVFSGSNRLLFSGVLTVTALTNCWYWAAAFSSWQFNGFDLVAAFAFALLGRDPVRPFFRTVSVMATSSSQAVWLGANRLRRGAIVTDPAEIFEQIELIPGKWRKNGWDLRFWRMSLNVIDVAGYLLNFWPVKWSGCDVQRKEPAGGMKHDQFHPDEMLFFCSSFFLAVG